MMEEEEVTRHPSFANIQFSRISGHRVVTYSGARYKQTITYNWR